MSENFIHVDDNTIKIEIAFDSNDLSVFEFLTERVIENPIPKELVSDRTIEFRDMAIAAHAKLVAIRERANRVVEEAGWNEPELVVNKAQGRVF